MKILVGMSGGVDSSVTAAALQKQGNEVAGVYIRNGLADVLDEDERDARAVAERLGIELIVLDVRVAFKGIVDNFVSEYFACRTPNPCILCNRRIKFGTLYDFAMDHGFEALATGHYARLETVEGKNGQTETALLQALNPNKDQSYVLFGLDRARLPRLRFPLGGFSKDEIRQMARDWDLPVAQKKDSQDICFIPNGDHAAFLKPYKVDDQGRSLDTSGRFVTVEGAVVGTHDGIERFTVGQRKGLGVSMNQRYFVTRIDPVSRDVTLGTHEQLGRRTFVAKQANWLTDVPDEFRCQVKIRYKFAPAWATIRRLSDDGPVLNRFQVETDEAVFGVSPGQAVVCYDGFRVLGGGWICPEE